LKNKGSFVLEPLDPRTLLSAGDLDASFGSGGLLKLPTSGASAIKLQMPGGKFAFITADRITRLNADFTIDKTFGKLGGVKYTALWPANLSDPKVKHRLTAATVLNDGSLVLAGFVRTDLTIHASDPRFRASAFVFKFKPNGARDRSFAAAGVLDMSTIFPTQVGPNDRTRGEVDQIAQDSKGRLVFRSLVGDIGRLTATGQLDKTFAGDGVLDAVPPADNTTTYGYTNFALQSDDRILVTGTQRKGTTSKLALARLTDAGALDPTFSGDGIVTSSVGKGISINALSTGDILADGLRKNSTSGALEQFVARYHSNGSLDTIFGGDGIVTGSSIEAVAPDDSSLLKSSTSFGLSTRVRYNSDGTLDPNFGTVLDSATFVSTFDANGRAIAFDSSDHVARFVMNDTDASAGPVIKPDANGLVRVVGTDGADGVVLREEADGMIYLVRKSMGRAFKVDDMKSLSVTLLGGNDSFTLKNLAATLAIPMSISGGAGNDSITTAAGSDVLNGDDGNDVLSGGPGSDKLFGGAGNDKIISNDGTRDSVSGGGGIDTCLGDANDVLTSVEVH
jgi:uncharacterized delta-60 repeat protein